MDSSTALLTGALDQLMRHHLTGCGQAGHQAARLLDALSDRIDLDSETRGLCSRMCDHLCQHLKSHPHAHLPVRGWHV